MPIDYNPKDASNCWDEGDYPAVLQNVSDGYSKSSGNPMQTWLVEVYNGEKKQTIKEYVVIPAALFKVKQLAKALGKTADFNAGTFQPEHHVGASFVAGLTIEEQEGYDDKNKIGSYKPADKPASPPTKGPQRPPQSLGGAIRQNIQNRPAPTQPFGDEVTVPDEDIPF